MQAPLITVLMPVYNSEKYLHEAIESVLTQGFRDFEFIIIDDGSTDASVDIIQLFNDPRIRFYKNAHNEGISATLNRGIELAGCEWIARMDSDDICYSDRLAKQYKFILDHPDGALYTCDVVEVDENRNELHRHHVNPEHLYFNITFSVLMYHPTMIFRKQRLAEVGNYSTKYAEDWDLAWQLSRRFKLYHQSEALLEYRLSSTSLSTVTHKTEYDQAMKEQGLRNLKYFLGEQVNISDWAVFCLLNTREAINIPFTVAQAVQVIHLVALLREKTIEKDNVNRDAANIRAAAGEKIDSLLNLIYFRLNFAKAAIFLIRTGNTRKLIPMFFRRINQRLFNS